MAKSLEQLQAEEQLKLQAQAAKYEQQLGFEQQLQGLKQQQSLASLYGGDSYGGGPLATKSSGIPLVDAFQQYQNQESVQNPYNIGARVIRQTALPKSDNLWENILGSAAQGLLGGGLNRLGELDVESSFKEDLLPTLRELYPASNIGGADSLDANKMALIAAIGEQEQQNEMEQITGKPSTTRKTLYDMLSPEQLDNYLAGKAGVDSKGNPIKVTGNPKLSPISERMLSDAEDLAGQAIENADRIGKFKSWEELQASRLASGLDPDGDNAALKDFISNVILARSGKAATDQERKYLTSFIAGDITASPEIVAKYLRNIAQRTARSGQRKQQSLLKLSTDPTEDIFAGYLTGGGASSIVPQGTNEINENTKPPPGMTLQKSKSGKFRLVPTGS